MSSLDNRHLNHGFVTVSGHLPKVIEKEEMWEEEKGDRAQLILYLSLPPHRSMGYHEHPIFPSSTSPLVFGASLGLCFLHGQVFLSCTTTLEARMKTFLGSFLASKLPSQFLLPPQCWEKDQLFVGKPGKTPYTLLLSLQRPPMSPSTVRYSYYMKLTLPMAELAGLCDTELTAQTAVQQRAVISQPLFGWRRLVWLTLLMEYERTWCTVLPNHGA